MHSKRIMYDLAQSASSFGAHVYLHADVQLIETRAEDHLLHIRNARSGAIMRVQATHVIVAAGDRTIDLNSQQAMVSDNVSIQSRSSVMLVRQPAVMSENRVIITQSEEDCVNHIYHPGTGGGISILADANDLPCEPSEPETQAAGHRIHAKATSMFGDTIGSFSQWSMYVCKKTEVCKLDGISRDYSYWWGPRVAHWQNEHWQRLRQHDQAAAQDEIFNAQLTRQPPKTNCISTDVWATTKSLHFAALRSARQRTSQAEYDFIAVRDQAISAFASHATAPMHSAIYVIPGKFSLFPTLAHNMYLELELRGFFASLPTGIAQATNMADHCIASPRSVHILRNTRNTACFGPDSLATEAK